MLATEAGKIAWKAQLDVYGLDVGEITPVAFKHSLAAWPRHA